LPRAHARTRTRGSWRSPRGIHRLSLAHSQDITGRLLEAIVDAAEPLRLVEIEGDAAFLYLPHGTGDAATALALAMHRAFHARQAWMVGRNMCSCDACRQAGTSFQVCDRSQLLDRRQPVLVERGFLRSAPRNEMPLHGDRAESMEGAGPQKSTRLSLGERELSTTELCAVAISYRSVAPAVAKAFGQLLSIRL
jgi:hypothetical protein